MTRYRLPDSLGGGEYDGALSEKSDYVVMPASLVLATSETGIAGRALLAAASEGGGRWLS